MEFGFPFLLEILRLLKTVIVSTLKAYLWIFRDFHDTPYWSGVTRGHLLSCLGMLLSLYLFSSALVQINIGVAIFQDVSAGGEEKVLIGVVGLEYSVSEEQHVCVPTSQ